MIAQHLVLPFDRLTIDQGLPNPSVIDILQDDKGFIWIGTANGIVRYDGREMTTYYPTAGHPDSLPELDLPQLFQTKNGDIWVGLSYQKHRLFRYDPGQDRFIPFLYDTTRNDPIIQGKIFGMTEDRQGNLVVAADGQGVFVIETTREKMGIAPAYRLFRAAPEHSDSLPVHYFGGALVTDDQGHIWLPTDAGLCRFLPEENRFETYLASQSFSTVFSDKPRRLWVGTWQEGLIEFDTEDNKIIRQFRHDPDDPFSLARDRVGQIVRDRNGQLWISSGPTVDLFNPATGACRHVNNDPDKYHYFFLTINTLLTDRSHNIWIGAWQKGIFRYNPDRGAFTFHRTLASDKKSGFTIPMLEDREQRLWLGSERDGLVCWDRSNDSYKAFQPNVSDPAGGPADRFIYSVVEGSPGYLWVGTGNALSRLHLPSDRFRHFYEHAGAELRTSKDGTTWFSRYQKNFCRIIDEKAATTICYPDRNHPLAREISRIAAFAEDSLGHLWLGANQGGLLRFDPATEVFESILDHYGIIDIHVSSSYGSVPIAPA